MLLCIYFHAIDVKSRKLNGGARPSLQFLTRQLLQHNMQSGKHCSVEDARVTMFIYNIFKREWEMQLNGE